MTKIPEANYVIDHQGKKIFVQIKAEDWDKFVSEFNRIQNLLAFKDKLKNAFREVRQIQREEKEATTLYAFLHEL